MAKKIEPGATKEEPMATKKEPDFDVSQADAEAFAEVYSIYLKGNPGIEEMSIKDRRLWQRYLYRRDTADVPTRSCWYCKETNPLIETKCGNCFRTLSQEGTPARQPNIEDMRISHAIRLGRVKPVAWKFVLRGEGTGNRESQRCKDHYKRARQLGFTDCIHRFLNDPWYRQANRMTKEPSRACLRNLCFFAVVASRTAVGAEDYLCRDAWARPARPGNLRRPFCSENIPRAANRWCGSSHCRRSWPVRYPTTSPSLRLRVR